LDSLVKFHNFQDISNFVILCKERKEEPALELQVIGSDLFSLSPLTEESRIPHTSALPVCLKLLIFCYILEIRSGVVIGFVL
jgi:hypothetical protein